MRFVLDSSVGFKTLVAETDSVKAQQLYDDYLKGSHELVAPDVFPVEVAHSITRAERQARISPAQEKPFCSSRGAPPHANWSFQIVKI